MKTSQGQRVFSATLLKKVPEVVEAGLRDIDRTPKLKRANWICSSYNGNFPLTSIDKGILISPTWWRKTILRRFRAPLQPDWRSS